MPIEAACGDFRQKMQNTIDEFDSFMKGIKMSIEQRREATDIKWKIASARDFITRVELFAKLTKDQEIKLQAKLEKKAAAERELIASIGALQGKQVAYLKEMQAFEVQRESVLKQIEKIEKYF